MTTYTLRKLFTWLIIALTLSAGSVAFIAGFGSPQVVGAVPMPSSAKNAATPPRQKSAVRPAPQTRRYSASISVVSLRRYAEAVLRTGQGRVVRTISVTGGRVQLKLIPKNGEAALCLASIGGVKPANVVAVLLPANTLVPLSASGALVCAPAHALLQNNVSNVKVQFTVGAPVSPAKGPGDDGSAGGMRLPPLVADGRQANKKPVPNPVVVEIEDEMKKSFADWRTLLAQDIGLGRTSAYNPKGAPISWEGPGLSLIDIATGKASVSDELCGELRALLGHLISDVNDSGMEADAKAKALAALQAARADALCTAGKVAQALATAFEVPTGGGGTALQGQVRGLMQLITALGARVDAIGKLAADIQGLAGQIVRAPSDEKIDQLEAQKMKKIDELRQTADGYNNLKSLLELLILTLPTSDSGYDYLEAFLTLPGRVKEAIRDREATARRNALVGEALSDIQKDGKISSETEQKIQDALKEAKEAGQ